MWHSAESSVSVCRSGFSKFQFAIVEDASAVRNAYWFSLNTPKALANFSQGLLQPWDQVNTINTNAESVSKWLRNSSPTLSALVLWLVIVYPGLEQPWDQVNTINTNAESVSKWLRHSSATLSALVLWLVIVYPGLLQPWDQVNTSIRTLKALARATSQFANAFSVGSVACDCLPRGCYNPGTK